MRRYIGILVMTMGLLVLSGIYGGEPGFMQAQGLLSDPFVVPPEDLPDGPGGRGGSITMDLPSEPETFNPVLAQGESSKAVARLLNGTLFEYPRQPALVKNYLPSPDDTVRTLFLREGIRFSDGAPMACEDVAFTFNDVVFNDDVASAKEIWKIEGEFPEVECLDEYTVKITTPARFNGLIKFLLTQQPILPRHLLTDKVHKLSPAVPAGNFNTVWGVNTPPDQMAGLGPFRLSEYVPGQQVVLERNPYYWKVDPNGTQLPYLDQIILPIVRDDSVRVLRFMNGQTDLLRPRPEDVPAIEDWVEVLPAGMTDSNAFIFNQDVNDPALQTVFRDVRFRQAMSHAADRQSMITLSLNGYGESRYGPGISPIFWYGCQDHPDFPRFPFDPDRAAQILDELSLKDTDNDGTRNITDEFLEKHNISLEGLPKEDMRELKFEILTVEGSKPQVTDAEIYADTLKGLGLAIVVNPVPLETLMASLREGDYEAARVDFISNGDPNVLVAIYHSKGRAHYWKPSDGHGEDIADWQQRVDEILMAQKTADGETRWNLMCEFQRLVAENVPLAFLYNINNIHAYRKDRLGNFKGLGGKATILYAEYLFLK